MGKLTGTHYSMLQDLIVDAFNPESLFQLVRLEMGVDMYKEYVAPGQSFRDSVFEFIGALEEQGTTVDLIDKVIIARPNKVAIQTEFPKIRASLAGAPAVPAAEQVSAVVLAIETVDTKLAKDNLSQETAEMLKKLRSDLDLIQIYKTLHDCLHKAQMKLSPLESEARAVGVVDQEDAADRFDGYLNDFQMEGINAHQSALTLPAQPTFLRETEEAWLKQFDAAMVLGKTGVEKADGKSARLAASRFRSILRREPSRIDGILRACAGALNLEALKGLLDQVAGITKNQPAIVAVFNDGRQAAELIFRKLKALVNQHNQWQDIDQILWEAEDKLPASAEDVDAASDFELLWNDISGSLLLLVDTAPASDWARIIMDQKGKVDGAWKTQIFKDLARSFRQFRKQCLMTFFATDSDLKGLADEVAKLRESLNELLAKISS